MWVLRVCASDKLRLMARLALGRLDHALVEIEDIARIYMLNSKIDRILVNGLIQKKY